MKGGMQMFRQMTAAERLLAETHMDLVPKVVGFLTKVYPLEDDERQELCQMGYLALCRAALSCTDETTFRSYAYTAVRNAIYDQWRQDRKDKAHVTLTLDAPEATDTPLFPEAATDFPDKELWETEVLDYLERLKATKSGILRKGIESLCFQLEGYTMVELAHHYQAPANHVRAWKSKARKLLRNDETLCAFLT